MELFLGSLAIFGLRIGDVSISSVRIVTLMRGRIWLAALLGFFESLFWVSAAAIVFTNLDHPIRIVSFAAGFAVGTLLGGYVERWVAMGSALVRVIAPVEDPPVAPALRAAGFAVTVLNAEGRYGEVRLNFTVLPRRRVRELMTIVDQVNPAAFVTVEEVRIAEMERIKRSSAIRK
ncbi:MAG: DUF5698 domain-containing protein [Acidimicrobiia bacterium]|nr:MAG: DUF5698 domain-containing protein [Acidimicrobiia bacterium]